MTRSNSEVVDPIDCLLASVDGGGGGSNSGGLTVHSSSCIDRLDGFVVVSLFVASNFKIGLTSLVRLLPKIEVWCGGLCLRVTHSAQISAVNRARLSVASHIAQTSAVRSARMSVRDQKMTLQ